MKDFKSITLEELRCFLKTYDGNLIAKCRGEAEPQTITWYDMAIESSELDDKIVAYAIDDWTGLSEYYIK